jgi:hypothetical protein
VDESDLPSDILLAYPSNLPLAEHMHRLVTLNRSSSSLEFPKPLLGVYSTLDRSMVLSHNALRNSRLAASASRSADNRKSMVAPLESIARYR